MFDNFCDTFFSFLKPEAILVLNIYYEKKGFFINV